MLHIQVRLLPLGFDRLLLNGFDRSRLFEVSPTFSLPLRLAHVVVGRASQDSKSVIGVWVLFLEAFPDAKVMANIYTWKG